MACISYVFFCVLKGKGRRPGYFVKFDKIHLFHGPAVAGNLWAGGLREICCDVMLGLWGIL